MRKGFTLIELLVVIAVLGVLAAGVFVVINPLKRIQQAQNAQLQTTFAEMYGRINEERTARGGIVMGKITNNFCTDCVCRGKNTKTDSTCINATNASWQKITGKNSPLDPWGGVVSFDENEQEGGDTSCAFDTLSSAGPDNILEAGGDDIRYAFLHIVCHP